MLIRAAVAVAPYLLRLFGSSSCPSSSSHSCRTDHLARPLSSGQQAAELAAAWDVVVAVAAAAAAGAVVADAAADTAFDPVAAVRRTLVGAASDGIDLVSPNHLQAYPRTLDWVVHPTC